MITGAKSWTQLNTAWDGTVRPAYDVQERWTHHDVQDPNGATAGRGGPNLGSYSLNVDLPGKMCSWVGGSGSNMSKTFSLKKAGTRDG